MASILNVDQIKNANGTTSPPVSIPGHIIQMQSSSSTAVSSIATETYTDIPSMTATITPTSTSSKILIQVSFGLLCSSGTSTGCLMKLFRGSTEIGNGSGADTHNVFMQNYNGANNIFEPRFHMFVDSPSSTSAIVYKMQWRVVSASSGETWYMNRRGNDNFARTQSTFLLTEIAG